MKPDIVVVIEWNAKRDETKIYSNARDSALDEILTAFIQDMAGAGGDDKPAAKADTYRIKIGLRIEDDRFGVDHNCGNESLMAGIVMNTVARHAKSPIVNRSLDDLKVAV